MMTDWVLIQNGIAWEIFTTQPTLSPSLQLVTVEHGTVQVGDLWDAEAQTFSRPTPPRNTVVPFGVFVDRVTDNEYAAVLAAAQSNVQMMRWVDLVRGNGFVNVDSGMAIAAKAALVAANLLTSERADVIFADMG